LIGTYRAATPGTACGHSATSFILDDTAQPDLHLRIRPEYGGSSWVEGKYLGGGLELLTEGKREPVAAWILEEFLLWV
jgi:hypothetical protein